MIKTFKSRAHRQGHVNDLIDNLFDGSGQKATRNLSPAHYILSNPDNDADQIQAMFDKYCIISAAYNENYNPADIGVFRTFIADSFYTLREQLSCSRISFLIQEHNGRPHITATKA
jgi:hypothetical protein